MTVVTLYKHIVKRLKREQIVSVNLYTCNKFTLIMCKLSIIRLLIMRNQSLQTWWASEFMKQDVPWNAWLEHLATRTPLLQFFSVTLVHFSDQNWNSQNYLFNLHIIVSLVHIKKAVSHFFEQVANALVHPCKWLCTILFCFLHYQLLMSCWSKCIIMGLCWIVSPPTTFRH